MILSVGVLSEGTHERDVGLMCSQAALKQLLVQIFEVKGQAMDGALGVD
jgi:hypothetical protein